MKSYEVRLDRRNDRPTHKNQAHNAPLLGRGTYEGDSMKRLWRPSRPSFPRLGMLALGLSAKRAAGTSGNRDDQRQREFGVRTVPPAVKRICICGWWTPAMTPAVTGTTRPIRRVRAPTLVVGQLRRTHGDRPAYCWDGRHPQRLLRWQPRTADLAQRDQQQGPGRWDQRLRRAKHTFERRPVRHGYPDRRLVLGLNEDKNGGCLPNDSTQRSRYNR